MDNTQSFDIAAELVLEHLARELPLALWAVTRVENERQTFLYLNEANGYGIRRGDFTPWDDTYCIHMAAQDAPTVTTAAAEIPAYRRAGEVNDLKIATYAGAVINESSGQLFGTICGFDPESRLSKDDLNRAVPLLSFMGEMLTLALGADRDRDRIRDALASTTLDAETDALTGIANRRGWNRTLAEEEPRFRRLADPTVIVVADLDRLKAINDAEGHTAGDEYLRRAAAALRAAVRATDVVARIGGDEFALLLRHCEAIAGPTVLRNIHSSLAEFEVDASVGWAPATVPDGLAAAFMAADSAMYVEKDARRVR